MFAGKTILSVAVTATLLIAAVLGAYPALAQTQPTPTAIPAVQTGTDGESPAFVPMQMAETMAAMIEQMEAMMAAAPDDATRRQMAPAMMTTLSGMMALNRTMMGQMSDTERTEMAPQMMAGMTRMTEMMAMMQPMMGHTTPMSGTVPMSKAQVGPIADGMQMGPMMNMMGMMMQMMGHMHTNMMGGEMMGPGMMGEAMGRSDAMADRRADVAKRGAQVMPFDLEQTLHVFEKRENGGVQQVLTREGADPDQVPLIQEHLSQEADSFQSGNFDDPAQIHGAGMPGLTVLRQRADDIVVRYTPLAQGGQIEYVSDVPEVVEALHLWFDAQLSDHGDHAMGATPSAQHRQPVPAEAAADVEVAPQTVGGRGVMVKVTPLTLLDATAATLDFAVVLDTHSVELNNDLSELAILRDDQGNEFRPATWATEQDGGHHVNGVLSFAERAAILASGVASLELEITGIAGVPSRLFTWNLEE